MQTSDAPQISTEEKIKVLLNEYGTLRQEIIARTTHGFQLLSVGSVVLALVMTTQTPSSFFWYGLAIAVVVYMLAVWFTLRDISKAASRVRDLEKDINRRAGEELLVWESKYGAMVTGFWGRSKPLLQSAPDNDT